MVVTNGRGMKSRAALLSTTSWQISESIKHQNYHNVNKCILVALIHVLLLHAVSERYVVMNEDVDTFVQNDSVLCS